MKSIDKILEFIDYIKPLLDSDKMTEEVESEIAGMSDAIVEELGRAVIVKPEHSVVHVTTFEDLSVPVEDTVEFEAGEEVRSLAVHSITQAEASHIRRVLLEGNPTKPVRRVKDGVPDMNDTVYDKEIIEYEIKLSEHNNKVLFEYLKVGMKIEIKGANDKEKFDKCEALMAGLVNKIAQKIMDISCLNEGRIGDF